MFLFKIIFNNCGFNFFSGIWIRLFDVIKRVKLEIEISLMSYIDN